jgi:hypothetical protein
MRIAILALDELFDTGLTVMLDAFTLANKFSALQMGGRPRFDLSIVGVRRRVRSGQGLSIPVQAITPALKPEWAVVPALNTGRPEQLIQALERRDVIQAGAQVRKWHAEGAQIAASCVGTFLVAQARLLDGRQATTTWWLAPLFRQRYPNVLLDETRMLVPTDVGVTAGAAMGHLDTQGQSGAGFRRLALSARGHPDVAGALHHPQPSGASRSARSSLREVGAQSSQGRILAAGSRQCAGDKPAYAATPLRGGARQISAVLFSGPSRRARAVSAPWQRPRRRRDRRRGRLCRRSDLANAAARTPGAGRARASRQFAVTSLIFERAFSLSPCRPNVHL